jgi:hypothetical protein
MESEWNVWRAWKGGAGILLLCLGAMMAGCGGDSDDPEAPVDPEPEPEPVWPVPEGLALADGVNTVALTDKGSQTIEVNVTPADLAFNHNVTSDACQITLEGATGQYALTAVTQAYYDNGQPKTGTYTVTFTDGGSFEPYDDWVSLKLAVQDADGGEAAVSSAAFRVRWTPGSTLETGLPVVYIQTPGRQSITSKDTWMADVTMTIVDTDGDAYSLDYQGSLSMKGRGNSTWGYPKKPYALKLDSKSKILGMKKHKRWCLLANWMDRTLMRNAVAFEVARRCTALDWTPSGRFVEVVLNGKHQGNYWLTEQIKVDGNRVDVTELDTKATQGDGITGGYIFELDTYYDEAYKFYSPVCGYPWQFKDPDEVNEAQYDYVVDYVGRLEASLTEADRFKNREFAQYLDLESLADWWLVYELAQNWEPNHPKSCYFHKDVDSKDGRLKAGPVWDFDWGTFIPQTYYWATIGDALYYKYLMQDAQFKALVKARWQTLKPQFQQIGNEYIDSLRVQLTASDKLNAAMWPIWNVVNGDESLTFNDAVDRLKTAYKGKLNWLDQYIGAF